MPREQDVKWGTGFACEINLDDMDMICNTGIWPSRPDVKGVLKGYDIRTFDIHGQKIPLSSTRVADSGYISLYLNAEHGNIIGCYLDEGIINCAEGKDKDEIMKELELCIPKWKPIF